MPMRMIKLIAAVLLLAPFAGTTWGKINVQREPADVKYVTFDPASPPAEMPHLRNGEDAVTVSSFGISAQADSEVANRTHNADGWTSSVDIHSLTIRLKLRVIVYTPKGANDKLKAHEEGHRKIAEQVYKDRSMAAAQAAGALFDGKRLTGDGPNWKTAADNAVNPIMKELGDAYMKRTAAVSDAVNNFYDDITGHGTNVIVETQAIKDAFNRYIKDHPTTRPAK